MSLSNPAKVGVMLLWLLAGSVWAGAKDDPLLTMFKLDQLEVREQGGANPVVLEGSVWAGYDLSKVWLKTELERVGGETEALELQALYSRAIAPFWDVQLGGRRDLSPNPDRSWGVLGIQGLAPYFFEVDAALFFGGAGRSALRIEAEYELMLARRWVLSPELEANAYGHNDRDTGVGSGLADIEAGLRLRFEVRREMGPYVGINWTKKYGRSADFASQAGEDSEDVQFVVGLRAWY